MAGFGQCLPIVEVRDWVRVTVVVPVEIATAVGSDSADLTLTQVNKFHIPEACAVVEVVVPTVTVALEVKPVETVELRVAVTDELTTDSTKLTLEVIAVAVTVTGWTMERT